MQQKIKKIRLKVGKSLADLSRDTGMSKGHLSRIDNGLSVPPIPTLKKIAKALGVDWKDLI